MDLKTKRDVIVVGAGAAGLTAALHLANQDLTVSVIDGAVHPGAENWSGCVFFGENLAHKDVLGPNWQENTAIERPLVARGVYMTNGVDTAGLSYKDPDTYQNCATVLRPVFDHDLSEITRSKGVEILSRTTAIGLIKEEGKVIGVSTEKGPIYSDLVFLAEGDAAHLVSKEGYSNLPAGDKGHYLQGIKEVIHLPSSEIEKRFKVNEGEGCAYEMIIRNARIGGKTVQLNMGAFIYTNRESLSIGLVLPLDNLATHFKGDHNNLMEWFKSLPIMQKWTEGGERTAYGAKIINANGFKHLANFCDDGLAIGGACTGIGLDFPYPNYTGPASFTGLCLGKAVKEIKANNGKFNKENLLEHYESKIRNSQYYKDMEVTKDWAEYIAGTQAFFSLFTDLKMDCGHPFFEKDKSFFSAFRESARSFFYHGQGKLGGLITDLRNQQRCAGASAVSPLGFIKGLFSGAPLEVDSSGDLRVEFFHGSEEVTENMSGPIKSLVGMLDETIKGAFNTLYRNDGVALKDRFETLNCIIGKQAFLPGVILLLVSPFMIILGFAFGIIDSMTSKKKLMQTETAKRVMAARKAQEISSFKAPTSVEDKLATIVYETEKDCHIKVQWPLNKFLPESDPNSALWHICPAGVYHAKSDPAGMLRPVVDYENCVKCESCWRGSPLADWGRRDSHRLIYRVKTTAVSSLIRHLSASEKPLPKNDGSEYNSPVHANEEAQSILRSIDSYINRIHEIIHSTNRTLDATQRFWIKQQLNVVDDLIPDLEKCYDGERSAQLLKILNESIENAKEFHRIERFFWIDAELLKLRQHCLTQLGLTEPSIDNLIPDSIEKIELNAEEHFTHAHIHHIKENGLSNADITILKSWIEEKDESKFTSIILELSKIDLSLTATVMMAWLGRKFSGEERTLLYSNTVTENPDGTLSGHIPFALAAVDKKWLLIQDSSAWLLNSEADGLEMKEVGTVGLRSSLPTELTLTQLTAQKLANFNAEISFKESASIFSQAVIGAGDYLLQKSMDHGTGRIQFPDLFQDEHGRDGIIKFGAVKSLISHIACRLELLKIAAKSDISEHFLYVQAGKWLGTQEGSFTYNASQVFGGTGFSEDDTLSPYYRDASIFKYLMGDPYVIQKNYSEKSQERNLPKEELLEPQFKWLDLALEVDKEIAADHNDLSFRAEMDYSFLKAAINEFIEAKQNGESLLLRQQIIDLAARIYWNSATNRQLDSKSRERHIACGKLLVKKDWKNTQVKEGDFKYEEFLESIPAQPTGYYLTDANFDIPKYSKESLKLEDRLYTLGQTLNNDFKEYFIDKDFDGMSYIRYAEAKHGHSNEVIKMFHDKGYMRLIIPSELGGGGSHKAEYYLLISASMQYGDPALSLIIQASTSIGTSPMLLAYKKDVPRAIKEISEIKGLEDNLKRWSETCKELDRLVKIPDPAAIKSKFKPLGEEVKGLAKKNSVFKSYCGGFLYDLHKAGQAGMNFQLDLMGELLLKAARKLDSFIPRIDELSENFDLRKDGVGFFLSMIASGQTSAFALTEPSAGSDTARVATRAELKEVEVTLENSAHVFEIDGEKKVLITLNQTRYEDGNLQIRLQESEEWADVMYDKYNWEDDSGYRYFMRNGEEFVFNEFGNITERDGKILYIYYELTGSKMWITNGRFAGLFAMYAKTSEGVTGFCCDRYIEGLTIGKDEDKMGQNASPTNEVFLERARISKDFVLGIEGRGQVNALETLNVGRAGLSLSSLALSEDVLDAAIEISSDSDDDMALLGKMSEEVFGGFASAYEMIGIFDKPGSDARMESAIGKFMNSEILHRVILYSEGIHGAQAQTFNHDVEKKKRDARILNIYEGTNEIQRFLILKDLVEQVTKKNAVEQATYSKNCNYVKTWDSARLKLLHVVKQIKLDIGSKAWMDAQLQPVFFPLAEIAGWLKYSEGAIWRYNDIKDANAPEVLRESLIGSIERSFNEMNRRFILFEETYANLSKGIRPPEISICSLLLDEDENKEEDTLLDCHSVNEADVTTFLNVRPLNKPEVQIFDGHLIETSSVLTSGSEVVLKTLTGIPSQAKKRIVITAPNSAESLIKHLSSYAEVTWLESNDVWPTASDNARLWLEADIQTKTVLLDASTPEFAASARYFCEKANKNSINVNEFQLVEDSIKVVYEGNIKSIGENSALLLNSSFTQKSVKPISYNGSITRNSVEVSKSSETHLPPEPPKTEVISIESPENAADYLKQELGLEEGAHDYEIQDSDLSFSGTVIVGTIKDGDISRDTLAAVDALSGTNQSLTLCLAGAEGFDKSKIQKLATLPNHICLIDFPEVWLKDPKISSQYINKLLSQSELQAIYFASSLAGEAGIIAAEKNLELKTGVTKVRVRQNGILISCENAEGTVEEQYEVTSPTVAIMASNLLKAKTTSTNNSCSLSHFNPQVSLESVQDFVDLLNKSANDCGADSIEDANFIIDIGYGIGNQDNYDEFITPLTETLKEMDVKFSIGASRKLVETLKILPPETQIGQSGSTVAPTILIAVGISGAPQHINYIGKNTSILCFNIDAKAPLMVLNESKPFPKVYPLAGDLKHSIPKLTEALKSISET